MDRKIVLKALVGSHNYNLNTLESDKDYKVFVLPTLHDLYYNKQYSNSIIGENADYDYHDIRKLVNLFWKSNVNFIEVLYSNEIEIHNDYIQKIYNMRHEIVTMNLPYLYKACKGMYFNKVKYLEKGTSGTQHLVDQYGYDTKQATHAYRILDFIMRFADNDFTDFKASIEYSPDGRDKLLEFKNGKYSLTEFQALLKVKLGQFEKYEDVYMKQLPKEDVKENMDDLIYEMVREHIQKENLTKEFLNYLEEEMFKSSGVPSEYLKREKR